MPSIIRSVFNWILFFVVVIAFDIALFCLVLLQDAWIKKGTFDWVWLPQQGVIITIEMIIAVDAFLWIVIAWALQEHYEYDMRDKKHIKESRDV
jgi:hypothetical protein